MEEDEMEAAQTGAPAKGANPKDDKKDPKGKGNHGAK